jgi:PAS domain-containing protein
MPPAEHLSDAPETWKHAAFDALAAHIAVLDAQGTIVAVNAAWEQFGRARGA